MSIEVQQQPSEASQNRYQDRSEISRLLELRAVKKQRTPRFQRQESWRYVRIHEPWRKPKGVDSHMRLSIKGWPHLVKIGYRGPRPVRGLHPSGYRDVLVHNPAELEGLSPLSDAARLAAGVGRKKRIEIARRAKELGIRVLNGGGLLSGQDISTERREKEAEEQGTETSVPPREEEISSAAQEVSRKIPESSSSVARGKGEQQKRRAKKSQKKKSGKKPTKASKKKTSKAVKKTRKKGKK